MIMSDKGMKKYLKDLLCLLMFSPGHVIHFHASVILDIYLAPVSAVEMVLDQLIGILGDIDVSGL